MPAPDAVLDDDYGDGESIVFAAAGHAAGAGLGQRSARSATCAILLDGGGDVIGWNHETAVPAGTIGFDPERGRVLLGAAADGPLLATFHYGTPREIGGGEYERTPEGDDLAHAADRGQRRPAAARPRRHLRAAAGC